MSNRFSLKDKVVVITGGGGLLGINHAEAVIEADGIPILLDVNKKALDDGLDSLRTEFAGVRLAGYSVDITREDQVHSAKELVISEFGRIDALVNNAANNPRMEGGGLASWSRLENFPEKVWHDDIQVGLTGAMQCSRIFGAHMASHGGGVIVNIASDLGLIAPDQRIYRKDGLAENMQPVKPVTYSVVKHGLIGLTKYIATYWAANNVRCNALCPGGVENGQPDEFVHKLTNLIPFGRMARKDEYKAAIVFLCSDASSYMTGSVLAIDGGRSCW